MLGLLFCGLLFIICPFLETISFSVLVSIFGIFKLFLHTMHLIIYTIFIDKWKEKQKGNLYHFSYHNQVYYNIPISSFHSLYNTTVWQIHLDFYSGCYLQLIFWYIHDDVVQTLPILDRQYQMLFYLSFLCNCYHFSCVYSHLINHKVLLIIRVD